MPRLRQKMDLMQDVSESPREVLIAVVREIVSLANEEQLQSIRSIFMKCMSLSSSSSSSSKKRQRLSSPQQQPSSCAILCVSDDVISTALFPLIALSDHCRLARTCRHMLALSGCTPLPIHVRTCVWNKQVRVPVDVDDHTFAKMCQFVRAPSLNMYGCKKVTNFAHIKLLPIRTLSLSECGVTDACLAHLQHLHHLRTLNLARCVQITDQGLAHLEQLPLTGLNLRECRKLTAAGLIHLRQMPLKKLQLTFNLLQMHINDAGLNHLLNIPLEILSLTRVSDQGLFNLGQISTINNLNLSYCEITDAGLSHLQHLPIHTLKLASCHRITDAGIIHLRQMPLKVLYVSNTNITNRGLDQLNCSIRGAWNVLPAKRVASVTK